MLQTGFMDSIKNKPILIFLIASMLISIPLFTLPINLFQGVIIQQNGLQEVTLEAPLSLSYFVGFGYNPDDMIDVVDFYLKPSGWILALIFTVGIPALLAYRIYLSKDK